MKVANEVKELIVQGIEVFNLYDRCFMGYQISKDDPLTFHHIIPARNKIHGLTVFSNMALLTISAHAKFNLIERTDYITSKQLNRTFKELNESMLPPTEEYYDKINYYLEKYEKRRVRIYMK